MPLPAALRPHLRRPYVLRSLAGYERGWLRPDVLAGATLAAVLIPQGMAYAEVAGMPPVTGLYATVLPLVAFALFGGSRHLVLGPDTSTSALVAAVLAPLAVAGSAEYVELATALAVLTGGVLLLARVCKLGFLSDFLAAPVIVGYQTGLGIEILLGQLPKTLGLSIDADGAVEEVREIVASLGDVEPAPALVGLGTLAVILVTKRRWPAFPGVLLAVGGATLITWAFDLQARGVGVLGELSAGLPTVGIPSVDSAELAALLGGAASVALVSFTDTVVESRTFAAMGGYDADIDRDMVGIGTADVASGVFGAFPISASGSRTAVLTAAGGRTQAANLAAAFLVVAALLLIRPVLEEIPSPALGAVVMSAGLGLLDIAGLRRLWRLRRTELAVAVVTLASVLLIGLLEAVLIAVVLSLLDFVRRGARPADAVLARVPGREGFHTLARNEEHGRTVPGVIVYRFDAPLFFANAEAFRERVERLVRTATEPVSLVVVDGSTLTDVDTTAADAFIRLLESLERHDVRLALADPVGVVRHALERYGVLEHLAGGRTYETIDAAIEAEGP